MENSVGNKRSRETSPEETPESKRLHAELLFGILLEEDSEGVDRDAAGADLATVMKSLEDEIALPIGEGSEAEMGYLLEASDDDLGLPPAAAEKWWAEEEVVEAVEGFGEMWGFEEEEMDGWCGGMVEMGGEGEEKFGEAEEEDGGHGFAASFDGGLFDFSDFCWRPESLPTQ